MCACMSRCMRVMLTYRGVSRLCFIYIYIYIYMLHLCYFTILISIESVCCGSGVGKLDVTITDHAY